MLTIPPLQLLPLLDPHQFICSSTTILIHLHHRLPILEASNPGEYFDPEVIVHSAGQDANPV